MKQFVIMCGGVGSRLKLLKKKIPKCLVKVNNKTLLEHQVLLAKKNNFKSYSFSVCLLSKNIK